MKIFQFPLRKSWLTLSATTKAGLMQLNVIKKARHEVEPDDNGKDKPAVNCIINLAATVGNGQLHYCTCWLLHINLRFMFLHFAEVIIIISLQEMTLKKVQFESQQFVKANAKNMLVHRNMLKKYSAGRSKVSNQVTS